MKYIIKHYVDIKDKVETMSTEELLNCVICPDYPLRKKVPARNTTALMFHPTDTDTARKASMQLNEGREDKALVVADLEYGAGKAVTGAVEFPSMRAVAETGDERLAYDMGRFTAAEARLAGYHWTFGPCVDILGNKRNPVVSIRTAGEDAETVICYGGAYMRGLQDGGMIATLKHFPGDGYCDNDQHITTPQNPLSKEEWDESFGRVYRTLIEDGVMAIMPGHISLPSCDVIDPETGLYPPATVSEKLLTDLLRKQLGFEGIIVSDAINMGGFCGYTEFYHACARFLEAGGDCLLFMHPSEEYYEEMKKEIRMGTLRLETLKKCAYRMLCFSKEYFEKNQDDIEFDSGKANASCEEIAKKCVKIVRDRKNLLPLNTNNVHKILHVILSNPGMTDAVIGAATDLTCRLEQMGIEVSEQKDPGCDAIRKMAKSREYDLIICSVINEMSYGLNTVKLAGPVARNMMGGWMRFGTPTVFVSYYDPYFGDDFCASTDTLINAYGYCEYTNKYVVERMFL